MIHMSCSEQMPISPISCTRMPQNSGDISLAPSIWLFIIRRSPLVTTKGALFFYLQMPCWLREHRLLHSGHQAPPVPYTDFPLSSFLWGFWLGEVFQGPTLCEKAPINLIIPVFLWGLLLMYFLIVPLTHSCLKLFIKTFFLLLW